MAVLTLLSVLLVRNLKVENPGKKQLALEAFIGFLDDFFTGILGKDGKPYIPYLITVALYKGCEKIFSRFCGTAALYRSHQYYGDCDTARIPLYAALRQCNWCFCHYGIDKNDGAGACAYPIQHVF